MRSRDSIVFRLVLVTTVCISLIFAATLGSNYYSSHRMLEKDLESNSRNLALSLVNRVETELAAVAAVTAATARAIETGRYSGAELLALIRSAVAQNPAINGAGVAFEPFAFSPDRRLYAPFFYRENDGLVYSELGTAYEHVPYLFWDWYQIPDIPSISGRYSVGGRTIMPYLGAGFGGGYTSELNRSLTGPPPVQSDVGLRSP